MTSLALSIFARAVLVVVLALAILVASVIAAAGYLLGRVLVAFTEGR